MAEPVNCLVRGQFALHRVLTGAPVVADTTDLAAAELRQWILQTTKWKSIYVGAVLTALGAASVDVEFLYWDANKSKFFRLDAINVTSLDGSTMVKLETNQLPGIVRVENPIGNPTVAEIRVAPAEAAGMD